MTPAELLTNDLCYALGITPHTATNVRGIAAVLVKWFGPGPDESARNQFRRGELELALERARAAEKSRDLIQVHANDALEKYRAAPKNYSICPDCGDFWFRDHK